MNSVVNAILEGESVADAIGNSIKESSSYEAVSNAFKKLHAHAYKNYEVGDIESPDEKHDRFFVSVNGRKYFWVEMNYETQFISIYCHPNNYKCVGSNEKFNVRGSFQDFNRVYRAIEAYREAMLMFAV